MSGRLSGAIGLLGSAMPILDYVCSNAATPANLIILDKANLIIAVLLTVSLTAQFTLAVSTLQNAWRTTALSGLFETWRLASAA